MKSTVEFTRIRDVKAPNRANAEDAGTDFFIPNYSEQFIADLKAKNEKNAIVISEPIEEDGVQIAEILIPAGEQINIPSGIKVNIIDKDTFLGANNKSGIATKYHLTCGACIIDAGYQGEMHLNMMNVGNTPAVVKTGMKIVQFIQQHYIDTQWQEISNDEYNNISASTRGEGGFGSSGIK